MLPVVRGQGELGSWQGQTGGQRAPQHGRVRALGPAAGQSLAVGGLARDHVASRIGRAIGAVAGQRPDAPPIAEVPAELASPLPADIAAHGARKPFGRSLSGDQIDDAACALRGVLRRRGRHHLDPLDLIRREGLQPLRAAHQGGRVAVDQYDHVAVAVQADPARSVHADAGQVLQQIRRAEAGGQGGVVDAVDGPVDLPLNDEAPGRHRDGGHLGGRIIGPGDARRACRQNRDQKDPCADPRHRRSRTLPTHARRRLAGHGSDRQRLCQRRRSRMNR